MKGALTIALATLLVACGNAEPAARGEDAVRATSDRLRVYVVNEPLRAMAERIGGDRVRVAFPAPPGVDPATWIPAPEVVAEYQEADLILRNGAGYARWVAIATLPERALVDTSASFQQRLLPLADDVVHTHGPGGEHSHSGVAFTTWLDPMLAAEQARAVAAALAAARPDAAPEFEARLGAVLDELDALDRRFSATAETLGSTPLLFSHPVYQYFAHRYALDGRALHWEPGEAPTEAMWDELAAVIAERPAAWMIWEGEPLAETRRALSERGVESVVIDPCGNRPDDGDFFVAMAGNAARFERVANASPRRE